jgi:hypothetical protein
MRGPLTAGRCERGAGSTVCVTASMVSALFDFGAEDKSYMQEPELYFVSPTYRLREVGETVEQYDEHFWRNGQSVRVIHSIICECFVELLRTIYDFFIQSLYRQV